MPKINQLNSKTVPSNNDEFPFHDPNSGTTRKITRGDLIGGAPLPANSVDAQAIAANAIGESVTGGSGVCTKFHDGTMICTGSIQSDSYSFNDQTVGNLMRGARATQAFPADFISAPSLNMTPYRRAGANELYFVAQGNVPRNSDFDWAAIAGSTAARDIGFTWTAIGRWK